MSYRQALAEVVHLQERVEQAESEKNEKNPAAPGPRYVIGSSRHRMVAKLAPNLHWMAATPPLLNFLGCSLASLNGRSYLDIVHPADAARLRKTLKEALHDGEGHDITFRLCPPPSELPAATGAASPASATEYVVRMDVMTWYGEGGSPAHLRCHLLDITEKVRTEQELHRLQHDLRTRNGELARANDQLRRINQELQDFTYVVSHDLKEPLRTVAAFSTFLAQDYGPALAGEGTDYLNHLTQASRRLGNLIDDLLTLSRAGRVMNAVRAFAWKDVLETVRADLTQRLQSSQAIFRIEEPLPNVIGDENRVVQLLTNLVSNGLKYNLSENREVVFGSTPGNAKKGFVTFVCARQRHWHRAAVFRPDLHDVQASAHARSVRWHRRRVGHLQTDRRSSRRSDLGGVAGRAGHDLLVHTAASADSRRARDQDGDCRRHGGRAEETGRGRTVLRERGA